MRFSYNNFVQIECLYSPCCRDLLRAPSPSSSSTFFQVYWDNLTGKNVKKLKNTPHEIRKYIAKRNQSIRKIAEYWRWPMKLSRHAFKPELNIRFGSSRISSSIKSKAQATQDKRFADKCTEYFLVIYYMVRAKLCPW